MFSPGVDRGEAMRLINEIAMSDVWVALTGNLKTMEIYFHSDGKQNAEALIIGYACSNKNFRDKLIEILKIQNLL